MIPSLNHAHGRLTPGLYSYLVVVHFVLCISLYWMPPSQQRSVLWLLQRLEGLPQLLAPSTPPQVPPPEMFFCNQGKEQIWQIHDLFNNIYHWVETVQSGLVPCLSGCAAVGGKLEVELRFGLRQESQLVARCRKMNYHFSHLSIELGEWSVDLSEISLFLLGCKLTVIAVEQSRQW